MTIASQTSRISYTGDGVTTAFAVPFYFQANADIVVYLSSVGGTLTLQTLGTNYTLTGATLTAGGTCTFLTAPTSGYGVVIYRDPPITQTTSYNNNDPFPAKSHEAALDKGTMIDQRTRDIASRSVRLSDGDAVATMTLPSKALRATKVMGFDANGLPAVSQNTLATIDSLATAAQLTSFASIVTIATKAALKALTPVAGALIWVKGRSTDNDGGQGLFAWETGDYSTHIAADTNEGVFVKATSTAATVGAWLRQFDGVTYYSKWFGTTADHSTDNTSIINTIIATTELANTLSATGKQGSAYIEIERGVRFASTSLTFLAAAQHVFVYVRYFANSDTTQGPAATYLTATAGTNERMEISVNSGYPGDATGGLVAENRLQSPLHPAHILNVRKDIKGADAHLGSSQVTTPTSSIPARASYNIQDEGILRWRIVYENYASATQSNSVSLQPLRTNASLANVGSTGWPTTPATGTVVTGVTSGAKGLKAATQSNPTLVLDLDWVYGTFVAGERVTDGVTTSTNVITGGGVVYTQSTYPSLQFGYQTPVVTYGEFVNFPVTGYAIHARLTIGKTNSGAASSLKETVTNAAVLWTNTSNAAPTTGRQIVLDSSNRLVTVSGVTNGTGSTGNGLVGGVGAVCSFNNSAGVSTNAFNIASVTRTATGQYDIVFTNAMANANYAINLGKANKADFPTWANKATGGCTVFNFNSSAAATDLAGLCDVTITGGQ